MAYADVNPGEKEWWLGVAGRSQDLDMWLGSSPIYEPFKKAIWKGSQYLKSWNRDPRRFWSIAHLKLYKINTKYWCSVALMQDQFNRLPKVCAVYQTLATQLLPLNWEFTPKSQQEADLSWCVEDHIYWFVRMLPNTWWGGIRTPKTYRKHLLRRHLED